MNKIISKHIHIGSGGIREVSSLKKMGNKYELSLTSKMPIKDEPIEPGIEDKPAMIEVKKLMFYRKVPRKGDRVELEVSYCGGNSNYLKTKKIYRNVLDRQPCLLLALCNDSNKNKELSINSANKILNDKSRCRHSSSASDPYLAVHWVVKRIRREIGFTPKELYISSNASIVGLRPIS